MNDKPRFQFSIRTLLMTATLASTLCALYYRWHVQPGQVAAALEQQGLNAFCGYDSPDYFPTWLTPRKVFSVEGSCNLRAEEVALLNQCRSLEYLGLGDSTIDDAAILQLTLLPKCRTLEISGSRFTDRGFESFLNSLPNLTRIYAQEVNLTPHNLAVIARLPHLTRVTLDGSVLTDEGIRQLGVSGALQHLFIYASSVDQRTIRLLIDDTNIRSISVPVNCELAPEAITLAKEAGLQVDHSEVIYVEAEINIGQGEP